MAIRPILAFLLGLALAFAACGGGSSDTDEGTVTDIPTPTDTGIDPGTPQDPGSVEDLSTPQDPGTGGNPHPYWIGADWDTFLPAPGETAVYAVKTFAQAEMDLTASLERGVAYEGGTWDRIVIGTLAPGSDGSAIYVDLSIPWTARVKGIVVYDANTAGGPLMTETFADPIVIPLDKAAGQTTTITTTIQGSYSGFEDDLDVTYVAGVVSYDETREVPYGNLSGCAHFRATLSGELIGTGELVVDVWAHPQQRIVEWVDAPGFILARLKSAWQ